MSSECGLFSEQEQSGKCVDSATKCCILTTVILNLERLAGCSKMQRARTNRMHDNTDAGNEEKRKVFARELASGKTMQDSMLAAGYSANVAKKGRAGISMKMRR